MNLLSFVHEFCIACFIWTFTLYFRTNFSVFYMSFLLSFFAHFRPYFNTNFLLYFLLFFVTNRLPYILHCSAFVYEFLLLISYGFSPLFAQIDYHTSYIDLFLYHTWIFMNFECCTLENNEFDCITCITWIFDAKPILQCLWLFSFLADLCFHCSWDSL